MTRVHSVSWRRSTRGGVAHIGHNTCIKPDVWGRSTGTIFILVNIWSHIMVPQTSIMYTMAGDEKNWENKVVGSDWNFVHSITVSGKTHANSRSSESLSEKTIVPRGNLIGSVACLPLVLPIYVSPIVGGSWYRGGGGGRVKRQF